MICLHRLRGDELWVNPDLMVFVENNGHDTITVSYTHLTLPTNREV